MTEMMRLIQDQPVDDFPSPCLAAQGKAGERHVTSGMWQQDKKAGQPVSRLTLERFTCVALPLGHVTGFESTEVIRKCARLTDLRGV